MTARLNGVEHHPLHPPQVQAAAASALLLRRIGGLAAITGSLLLHVSLAMAFALGLARAGSEAVRLSRPDAIAVELVTLAAPPAAVAQPLPEAPPPQIAEAPFTPLPEPAKPAAAPVPEPVAAAPAPPVMKARPPQAAPAASAKRQPRARRPQPESATAAERVVRRVSPHRGVGVQAARPPQAASSAGSGSYRNALIRHAGRIRPDWNGKAGSVRLSFTVNRAGRLVAISVLNGSGQPGLDAATLAAARRIQPYPRPPDTVPGGSFAFVMNVNTR
jgi:protein TonB